MWRAVATGFVRHDKACFVANGLRHGFMVGVDLAQMRGHRWFTNYPSSIQAREPVTLAFMKRVAAGKSILLGKWSNELREWVRATFTSSAIVPVGAVPKGPFDPGEYRPTSDHTRTGLNHATNMDFLRHKLNSYSEIAWFLQQDHFMRVSDVESAFLMLPLHPSLWPFFMFRFFADSDSSELSLFMHVAGDFGAAGMPGVFKIFFVDVVVQMARACQIISLPMAIHVDDCGLIGPVQDEVDAEMCRLHQWAWEVCGVAFKAAKDRAAAQLQFMLGFWWDSRTFTRTLEERKLLDYMDVLAAMAVAPTVTLHELQSVAGKMQRAIMTFPPGAACLLVSAFTLMAGLKLPWHKRRTNRRARDDFALVRRLLGANMGRGFYSWSHFPWAPEVHTDASSSRSYTGGGYVSQCGMYNFWKYGTRASKKPIDHLEGDTVVVAAREMGPSWRERVVPIKIDSMAFEKSGEAGRSRVDRLNDLVRELFFLQLYYCFIFYYQWIGTKENFLADALSRNNEKWFLEAVYASGFWSATTVSVRHGNAGTTRTLPERRGVEPPELRRAGGVRRGLGAIPKLSMWVFALFFVSPVEPVRVTAESGVTYVRSTIFSGLPSDLHTMVDSVLDNRLSSSSWRTVNSGMRLWRAVAAERGWDVLILTDDPDRGGKMTALVCSMLVDTALVWGSIEGYVWGVRTYMTLQHQADPVAGVMGWSSFMAAVKVLTWVAGEPRKRFPVAVLKRILESCDMSDFLQVQMCFLCLVLLFTFQRSECPCPKSYNGRDAYDEKVHWSVDDFDVAQVEGEPALWVRIWATKTDQRVERPEARGEGDWVLVGDVPGSIFSIIHWYLALQAFHRHRPDRKAPMFVAADRTRPLIYRVALSQVQAAQRAVGVPDEEVAGLHGLRVEGWDATRLALGEQLAQVQGGWKSSACHRYSRFKLGQVYRIPAAMVQPDDTDPPDLLPREPDAERAAGPPDVRLTRAHLRSPDEAGASSSGAGASSSAVQDPAVDSLPPGWREELRHAKSRDYKTYVGGFELAQRRDRWARV